MRPSGPLPARVYWVRRLLVLAVVVLVVALVWWLLSSRAVPSRPARRTRSLAVRSGAPPRRLLERRNPSTAPVTDHPNAQGQHTQHHRHASRTAKRSPGSSSNSLPPPATAHRPTSAIAVSVPDGLRASPLRRPFH